MIIPIKIDLSRLKKCKTVPDDRKFIKGDLVINSSGNIYMYQGMAINNEDNKEMMLLKHIKSDNSFYEYVDCVEEAGRFNERIDIKNHTQKFMYEKIDVQSLIKKR